MRNQKSTSKVDLEKIEQTIKSFILELYKPAKTFAQSDTTLSTNELIEILKQSIPVGIDPEEVHNSMKELGFIQEETAGSVEWLLIKQ